MIPRISDTFLARFFRLVAWGGVIFAGAAFLVGPSSSFQTALSQWRIGLPSQTHFVVIYFSLWVATVSFFLVRIFQTGFSTKGGSTIPKFPKKPIWAIVIPVLLSLYILARSANGIEESFDYDEIDHVTNLLRGELLAELNPTNTTNHVISQALSYLSMKVFGINKFGARFPGWLAGLLSLVVLNLIAYRFLPAWGSVFVFVLAALSEITVWYFHSSRGYSLLLFVCLFSLYSVLTVLFTSTPHRKRYLAAFTLEILVSPWVHLFAAYFHTTLFFALVFSQIFSRSSLPGKTQPALRSLFMIIFFTAPVLISGIAAQTYFLARLGDFQAWKLAQQPVVESSLSVTHDLEARNKSLIPKGTSFTGAISHLFGVCRDWWGRIALIVFVVTVFLVSLSEGRKSGPYILFLSLIAVSLALTASLDWLFQFRTMSARYYLPYFASFLIFLVFAIEEAKKKRNRLAISLLTVVWFGVLPAIFLKAAREENISGMSDFETFVRGVREKTAPMEKACFLGSGNHLKLLQDHIEWIKVFYFHDVSHRFSATDCERTYLITVGTDLKHAPLPRELTTLPLKRIYHPFESFHLYELPLGSSSVVLE